MKIKTIPSNFNQKVVFDTVSLTFDRKGEADVSEIEGQRLLEKYPGVLFLNDYVAPKIKTIEDEITEEYVQNLLDKIESLEKEKLSLKDELAIKEVEVSDWASKYETNIKATENAINEARELREALKKEREFNELKLNLLGMKTENLRNLCSEAKFSEEEWGKMKKEELIEYLLKKS